MNTSNPVNEKPSKEEIQKRKNEIREYHQPLLDSLGIPLVYVVGKMHKQNSEGNDVVFLFPTELERGDDVYIEFTTRDYLPATTERKLFKWCFNPNWKKDYPAVEGSDHRLIPFSEFKEVVAPVKAENIRFELPVPGDEEDCAMKDMTLRDHLTLKYGKPYSLKPWLNKIVIENSK